MGRSDHFRNHQSALPSVVHHDTCTCNYVQNHTLGRHSMSRLRHALVIAAVCALVFTTFTHLRASTDSGAAPGGVASLTSAGSWSAANLPLSKSLDRVL